MELPLQKPFVVTEICGNPIDDSIEEYVVHGFQEFLEIKARCETHFRDAAFRINGQTVRSKYVRFSEEKAKVSLHLSVPTALLPSSNTYHLEAFWPNGKQEDLATIKFPGVALGNLKDVGTNELLYAQASQFLGLLNDKNRRVYELENSLSWRLTSPIRICLFLLPRLPLLFSMEGLKALKRMVQTLDFSAVGQAGSLSGADKYRHFLLEAQKKEATRKEKQRMLSDMKYKPLISVIIPTYNTPVHYLKECISSVLEQSYPHVEVCIYDDASTEAGTLEALHTLEKASKQIKISYGKENMHISEASNRAAAMARGEWIALLDHDDMLLPDALLEVVSFLNANPGTDMVYSDEDKLDGRGQRVEPYFKSGFNPDLLLSNNYINHLCVIRKEVFHNAGGFRKGYEGSQDHDLFLRIVESTGNIGHVPKVLYHWRKVPGSTADVFQAKSYPEKAGIKALEDYLRRNNIPGVVEKGLFPGCYRVKRDIVTTDKVAVIIPFKDQVSLLKICLESILQTISYPNIELILVNNRSEKRETLDYLDQWKGEATVLDYDAPFNFSAINNYAVAQTDAPYVLFLNNDIEAKKKGWFEAMLEHVQRPEVGAVGAKLLYPDGTVQHAGVVLGIGGVAGHAHKYFSGTEPGYFMRAAVIQNFSACTGACLMVKRDVFDAVGGFNEQDLKIAFNDIDLCLRIREKNKLIVFTPYAELIHHESKSRGHEDSPEKVKRFNSEVKYMKDTWKEKLVSDPCYNPNLTLEHENFGFGN